MLHHFSLIIRCALYIFQYLRAAKPVKYLIFQDYVDTCFAIAVNIRVTKCHPHINNTPGYDLIVLERKYFRSDLLESSPMMGSMTKYRSSSVLMSTLTKLMQNYYCDVL